MSKGSIVPTNIGFLFEVISGPEEGRIFKFDKHDTFVIGRSANAHLCLKDDPLLSRFHALIEVNPPACILKDLGSLNGTQVNGKKVEETALSNENIIKVGRTQIRVIQKTTKDSHHTSTCLCCKTVIMEDATVEETVFCGDCRANIEQNPQPIPGYEIVRQLGKGGMGVVHLARHLSSDSLVALKLIVPECANSESSIQLFLREASIISQLHHKRIVGFREFGMSQGQFFCAMEYVKSIDLKKTISSMQGSSRIKKICGMICQVLEALDYAHNKSFIHRDVKPQNILLMKTHGKLKIKLSDFGLAKNYENAGFSGMTRTGNFRGSIHFAPPEQIVHCRNSSPSVDIYATGGTLYYLLSNSYPLDFSRDKDPFQVILNEPIVPLKERCDVPDSLAEIVEKALQKEPGNRFHSAKEMHRALLPIAKGS